MRFVAPLLAISFALGSAAVVPAGADAPQAATAPASDRFILLEGGRNFRDVGGYRTADGHTVRRGVLYRSGSLGGLTQKGLADLQQLHVATIVDLRTSQERSHDTANLQGAFGSGYFTRDYGQSRGDMRALFSDPSKLTAASMQEMMQGAYRAIPKEQAPAYRELFARLIDGKKPAVVNCTAGKDRTGIATALVLTALGVPYETIRQDFLLSNGAPGMESLQRDLPGPLAKLPADVAAPLIGVEGAYLDTAFAQLRQEYGSIEGYLQKEVGVGPAEIAKLRRRMLR